ncbi:hypothetical protein J2X14_000784 [Pantoea alhagi]|uniref:dermonecrotic toxin domain-containing protein n=1 Tax=Mixta sp. BE291 TaxID=3158787 RepID=UPI00285DFCB3|nr:hypothetical protein [Pantoea alhagi]
MHTAQQDYRRSMGNHERWNQAKQQGQKEQDEVVQRLAAQPGAHAGNIHRQRLANAMIQTLSVLSAVRNTPVGPAITPARAEALQIQQRIDLADSLRVDQAIRRELMRSAARRSGENWASATKQRGEAGEAAGTTHHQPLTDSDQPVILSAPAAHFESDDNKPASSLHPDATCSDNVNIYSPLSSLQNAINVAEGFLRRYDPLTFPVAEAAALNNGMYIGIENGVQFMIKDDDGDIVELSKNYYYVEKEAGKKFIDKGKEALREFYDNYNDITPDLKSFASYTLRERIKERFHLDVNPDKLDFIRFEAVLYDGDKEIQYTPRVKKSLTEFLFTNFDVRTQNDLVDVDAMCGIYNTTIKENDKYEANKAIKIKPSEFIDLVWDIDFYKFAKEKIEKSLDENRNIHIKKYFIDAISDINLSSIDNLAAKDVLNGIGVLNDTNVTGTLFDIDGYQASNAFVFRNEANGRVTLYFPQSDFKFISFRGDFEMRVWVTNACATLEHRNMIASHFTIANRQDGAFYYGIDAWLNAINQDNKYYDKIAMKPSSVPPETFFIYLHDKIREKTLSDLDSLIKSDDEVKRDMWEEMIDASNIIPNPVSPFLSLGIHLEHAIDADTYQEKSAEWQKIKYDVINLIAMALMDKAIKFPDSEGYDFINKVKSGIESEHLAYKESFNEEEFNALADETAQEEDYDKEQDCYRVKRGATFGKLCSDGPDEVVGHNEMKIPNDFEPVDIQTWPDHSHLKFVPKSRRIAASWVLNKDEMIVYRQDNRSLEEIVAAGGFYPRTETIGTIEDHMLGSRKEYSYVSTSVNRLNGGSYGNYEYAIILKRGQAVDMSNSLNKYYGRNDPIREFAVPGIISPDQIVGWRKWK